MKNKVLFFLSVLFAAVSTTSAQVNKYHPLADSGNVWYTYYANQNPNSGPVYEYFTIYVVGGDTTINNHLYRKLLDGAFYFMNPNSDTVGYTKLSFGGMAIRDDTVNRKTFIYGDDIRTDSDEDQLLYDFDLNVGDTIPNGAFSDSASGVHVIFIDSILLDDGTYHKRWGLQSYLSILDSPFYVDTTYLIDGVGCTEGFMNTISGVYGEESFGWVLACFSADGNTLLKNPAFTSLYDTAFTQLGFKMCQVPTAIYNPNTVTAKLFPNPVTPHGSITIKGITEQYKFSLENLLGQTVFSKEITSPAQAINLPNSITSGVYLCHLQTESGLRFVKKIVVL